MVRAVRYISAGNAGAARLTCGLQAEPGPPGWAEALGPGRQAIPLPSAAGLRLPGASFPISP
jgi:hypothetical protein